MPLAQSPSRRVYGLGRRVWAWADACWSRCAAWPWGAPDRPRTTWARALPGAKSVRSTASMPERPHQAPARSHLRCRGRCSHQSVQRQRLRPGTDDHGPSGRLVQAHAGALCGVSRAQLQPGDGAGAGGPRTTRRAPHLQAGATGAHRQFGASGAGLRCREIPGLQARANGPGPLARTEAASGARASAGRAPAAIPRLPSAWALREADAAPKVTGAGEPRRHAGGQIAPLWVQTAPRRRIVGLQPHGRGR